MAVTVAGNVSDTGAGFALVSLTYRAGRWRHAEPTARWPATGPPPASEQDCAERVPSPQGLPIGSAGGNVVGDTTCGFVTTSDRQGANRPGLLDDGVRRRHLQLQRRLLRLPGWQAAQQADGRHGPHPGNQGYWEVASDGGIFSFGDAGFFGSEGGQPLNAPVVGIASTPDGQGYVEVASDGGVFNFGDAGFYGSMGGQHLNKPIVGIADDTRRARLLGGGLRRRHLQLR